MEKIEQFEKRLLKMTDAEVSQEFLEEYRKLVRKYKRDFLQEPPKIIKLEFVDAPKEPADKPAIK